MQMTSYTMFEIDKVKIDKVGDKVCLHFKKDLNRASIYLTFEQLETLGVEAQAEIKEYIK